MTDDEIDGLCVWLRLPRRVCENFRLPNTRSDEAGSIALLTLVLQHTRDTPDGCPFSGCRRQRAIPARRAARSSIPRIGEAAYHGLAGDIVRTIEPHTEADPVAISIQMFAILWQCGRAQPVLRCRGRPSSRKSVRGSRRRDCEGKEREHPAAVFNPSSLALTNTSVRGVACPRGKA